jgi:hypothetical protein
MRKVQAGTGSTQKPLQYLGFTTKKRYSSLKIHNLNFEHNCLKSTVLSFTIQYPTNAKLLTAQENQV